MSLPDRFHNKDVVKIGRNLWGEFVNTNGRTAWRLMDQYGRGVLLEGDEEFRMMIEVMRRSTDSALSDDVTTDGCRDTPEGNTLPTCGDRLDCQAG